VPKNRAQRPDFSIYLTTGESFGLTLALKVRNVGRGKYL
jgi:hypothetical protein